MMRRGRDICRAVVVAWYGCSAIVCTTVVEAVVEQISLIKIYIGACVYAVVRIVISQVGHVHVVWEQSVQACVMGAGVYGTA